MAAGKLALKARALTVGRSAAVKRVDASKAKSKASNASGILKKGVQLLDISKDGLVKATLIRRPSAKNRSPWVADVKLENGRIALAHVPALDMGGKCVAGSTVLLKVARDSKGKPIGSKAVGSFGTPKCEFIMQLVHVKEPENENLGGCWVAGHPSLGEMLANAILEKNLVKELPQVVSLSREVTGVAGTDMRADFVLHHGNDAKTVVEVKTVLDTDYNPATSPIRKNNVFLGDAKNYKRAGIFPWGSSAQEGPDGEPVVSARAIKHVDELAALARGDKRVAKTRLGAALFFVVVRHDVEFFRPNEDACPSFARHTLRASKSGVKVLAHRIRWGEGKALGRAYWDGPIKVVIPNEKSLLGKRKNHGSATASAASLKSRR